MGRWYVPREGEAFLYWAMVKYSTLTTRSYQIALNKNSVISPRTNSDTFKGILLLSKTKEQRRGKVRKFKNISHALPVWLSWLEQCPMHQRVMASIPDQGIYSVWRFELQWDVLWRQPISYQRFSPSSFFSL